MNTALQILYFRMGILLKTFDGPSIILPCPVPDPATTCHWGGIKLSMHWLQYNPCVLEELYKMQKLTIWKSGCNLIVCLWTPLWKKNWVTWAMCYLLLTFTQMNTWMRPTVAGGTMTKHLNCTVWHNNACVYIDIQYFCYFPLVTVDII